MTVKNAKLFIVIAMTPRVMANTKGMKKRTPTTMQTIIIVFMLAGLILFVGYLIYPIFLPIIHIE